MGAHFRNESEIPAQKPRTSFGSALLREPVSLLTRSEGNPMEVYYELAGDYTGRLDNYYRVLERRYQKLLREFHIASKIIRVALPVGIFLVIGGMVCTFILPAFLELFIASGSFSLVLALTVRRVNMRYNEKLEDIVDKLSGLYDIYLEILRVNEIVDAQKRGERIDELLKNKPLLKEIPCG